MGSEMCIRDRILAVRLKEILEDTYEINDSVSSASAYLRLTMVLNQMYVLRVVGINQQAHDTRE